MTYHSLNRLDGYLCLWAAWVRAHQPNLGFPPKWSFLPGSRGVHHFEDLVEQADAYAAEAVDALIDSLPGKEACQVHCEWLGSKARLVGSLSAIDVYARACDRLEMGLNAKGLP